MRSDDSGRFTTCRMLPPGRTYYFYSEAGRVLLQNDRPVGFHIRLRAQRNFIDVPKTQVFEGYKEMNVRDTPCFESSETAHLAQAIPAWDPYRSAFVHRMKYFKNALFDTGGKVFACLILHRSLKQCGERTLLFCLV